jgi:hypothetical protein
MRRWLSVDSGDPGRVPTPPRDGVGRAKLVRPHAIAAAVVVAVVAAAAPGAALAEDAGAAAAATAPAATAPATDPDAPTIAARADKTEAHVGDPIRVSLVAVGKAAIPVNLPGALDLGAFSVLSREEGAVQNLGDGRARREFVLVVAAYEPGDAELPAIDVTYLDARGEVKTVRTEPVAIKIASLLANEPEPTLKEGTKTVSVMEENRVPLYVGGGVLAAALGALVTFLIVRKLRMRPGERPGPPPRPAHEIALERLDRVGAYGFLENADNRPFYFAVSEIIRDYLGARYGFDSLEMTTDELVDELRRRAGRELGLSEVGGWLAACDLVKFAKVSPSVAEARGTLESAIRIVTMSRPAPEPVVPHAGAMAEARHA